MAGKRNLPLIVGLLLPVLLLAFLAGAVYIPRMLAPPPKYSFVYTTDSYGSKYSWRVEGERLKKVLVDKSQTRLPKVHLFDTSTMSSKELSEDAALELRISSDPVSPDGYEVETSRGGGIMRDLFVGYDRWRPRLFGHGTSRDIVIRGGSDYGYNFEFLGWVIE